MTRAFLFGLWVTATLSCDYDSCSPEGKLTTLPLEGTYVLDPESDDYEEMMDAVEGSMEVTADKVIVDYSLVDGSRHRAVLNVVEKSER